MQTSKKSMDAVAQTMYSRMKAELKGLDDDLIEIDGKCLKPSQCYEVSNGQILFNTNCPDNLRQKLNAIMDRYRIHA